MSNSNSVIEFDLSLSQQSSSWLQQELHTLEDSYAECLADEVDAKTLTSLWLRIKAINREMSIRFLEAHSGNG